MLAARWIVPVLLAGQFMGNLDIAITNVAMPAIGATLGASGAQLQLVISAYVFASAMLFVTAARLGERFGMRILFLSGTVVFTLASLACTLAPTAALLVSARLIQGIGAALMIAQVVAGIQRTTTGPARAKAMGAYTLTLSISAVVGQALSGVLVTANLFGTSWRPIFAINVPIGIALFAIAALALPRERGTRTGTLDFAGIVLLAAATLAFLAPLTFGRELGWPAWTWVALAVSAALTIAFGRWERSTAAAGRVPLLNLGLFASSRIAWSLVARACTLLTYFSLLFVIALYLQAGLGQSALVSGLVVVAWVGAYGLAGIAYTRLPPHLQPRCGPAGCAIMCVVYAAASAWTAAGNRLDAVLVILLALGGFGWGICSTAIVSQLAAAAGTQAPAMSGLLATLVPLGAAVGIATFGGLYLTLATNAAAAPHAFASVLAAFAVSAGVATLAAMRALQTPA
jgi:MFS family permease